jgi:hypothetical protein
MDSYLDNSVFFGRLRKGFLNDYQLGLKKVKNNLMKFHPMLLGAAILFTACSSPKYAYHFDHYDYSSGKKQTPDTAIPATEKDSPLVDRSASPVASTSNEIAPIEAKKDKKPLNAAHVLTQEYTSMSKTDRKEFRGQLKKEIKSYVKLNKVRKKDNGASVQATQAFDTTVALALVFGVAGIVLTVLASTSNVFWVLGAICIVIGAGLFVKWVSDGNG